MEEGGRKVMVQEEDEGGTGSLWESGEMCRSCTRRRPLRATTNACSEHRDEPAQLFPDVQFPESVLRHTLDKSFLGDWSDSGV